MATDLLAIGETWLADTLQASASTPATYRRGGSSVALRATIGGTVESPYGGSSVPAQARVAYLPKADLGLTPAAGDTLEWIEGLATVVMTLGPWGPNRAVYEPVDGGQTLKLYGQELPRLAGRKTVTVGMQRPASGTPNEYGEKTGTLWTDVADVSAELEPLAAGETEDAGKLAQLSKWRVFLNTSQAVAASWRLKVKSGPLTDRYLNVESVTPVNGLTNELMIVARMVGG